MPSEAAYGCRKYAGVHRSLDITDRDSPDFAAAQRSRAVLHACRMSQQRARFVKEGLPRFGQEQALTGPLKELQFEPFLEGKNLTTQRRSRDVKTQCGPARFSHSATATKQSSCRRFSMSALFGPIHDRISPMPQ